MSIAILKAKGHVGTVAQRLERRLGRSPDLCTLSLVAEALAEPSFTGPLLRPADRPTPLLFTPANRRGIAA